MGRTLVVWAVCLVPALTGCGALRHDAAPRSSFAREARRDARAAWQAVRDQHPDRVFSDEFRDGFIDGYADLRARGPVAPAPGADVSAREYQLGLQYATSVVSVSESPAPRPVVPLSRPASATETARPPAFAEPVVAPLPKPEVPVIKAFDPPPLTAPGAKFVPHPVPPGPDLLPVPNPPLPLTLPVPPASAPSVPPPAPVAPNLTILDDIPPLPFVPRP